LKQANDLVERNKMALAELTDRTNKLKNVAAENQFNTQYLSRAISALTLGQPTIFYGACP